MVDGRFYTQSALRLLLKRGTMEKNLIYVNAIVQMLERNLLDGDRLSRLFDCRDIVEAEKVLSEYGYADGYGKAINANDRQNLAFLREHYIKGYGLDAFFAINDFHNAKAYAKAKYGKLNDIDEMLAPEGNIGTDILRDGIFSDNYKGFPKEMSKALMELDVSYAEKTITPKFIDTAIDTAMFSYLYSITKWRRNEMTEFVRSMIDFANLSLLARSKGQEDITFIPDGKIPANKLDKAKEYYKGLPDDLIGLERYRDNYLLNIFKSKKSDMFCIAPLAGYYYGGLMQNKMLRILMTGIKHGVNKEAIRARMREVY
jgi:vacuolar-type H+-ATPase subunit C/Vma6